MYAFLLKLIIAYSMLEQAWTLATAFLKPYDLNDPSPRPRNGEVTYLLSSSQYQRVSPTDMRQIRAAFDVINKCRRLPVMLEVFLGPILSLSVPS